MKRYYSISLMFASFLMNLNAIFAQNLTIQNAKNEDFFVFISIGDTIPFRFLKEDKSEKFQYKFEKINSINQLYTFAINTPNSHGTCALMLFLDSSKQSLVFDSCKNGKFKILNNTLSEINKKDVHFIQNNYSLFDSLNYYIDSAHLDLMKVKFYKEQYYNDVLKNLWIDPTNPLILFRLKNSLNLLERNQLHTKLNQLDSLLTLTKKNFYYDLFEKQVIQIKESFKNLYLKDSFKNINGILESIPNNHKLKIVKVWATWCVPCKKDYPKFLNFKNQSKDVQLISISIDEDEKKWRDYKKSDYTIELLDTNHTLLDKYGVNSIPFYYILNSENKILFETENIDEINIDSIK